MKHLIIADRCICCGDIIPEGRQVCLFCEQMPTKKNVRKAVIKSTESEEQQALFQWATVMRNRYPVLELLYHVPNGGQRYKATAVRLKAEGVKSGVPDICLPVPKGKYHGLFLEMKVGNNKPTERQSWWIEQLIRQGYRVDITYGWQEAAQIIEKYLQLKEEQL